MTSSYRAPRGTKINCKGWQQEAALRLLMNTLDPEVAERPEDLVVYGGRGQAVRDWDCFDSIIGCLKQLENDETLFVQSGKPIAVFKTYPDAPRVLIANSNLVPHWATQEHFNELYAKGLIMYGQMTAGAWFYIGTQGILQGTFETLGSLARQRGWPSLKGRFVLTAGLGGMGGAQPVAIKMNEGVGLIVEVDPARAQRRLDHDYIDIVVDELEEAMTLVQASIEAKESRSIGLIGNAADIFPELVVRGVVPDVVTDQTPAHDILEYVPRGLNVEEARNLRMTDPSDYARQAKESIGRQVEAMLDFQKKGAEVFEYGNNLRQRAYDQGVCDAFNIPGFIQAYIRPLFCQGKAMFRWVALSGNPEDIFHTDDAVMELFPTNDHLHKWLRLARKYVKFQGLPARVCWLGYGERAKVGIQFNEMVAKRVLEAPIAMGTCAEAGTNANPNRETEKMHDGSDAISDWPILTAMANAVAGATLVSFQHGGGVGIGFSQHAGSVIVADGTTAARRRLERTLSYEPGLSIIRHADAGYSESIEAAKQHLINIPMLQK